MYHLTYLFQQPAFNSRQQHFNFVPLFLVIELIALLMSGCSDPVERKAEFLQRGQSYIDSKQYEKAEIEFKNVLQIDPKDPQGYYNFGVLEEIRQNHQRAFGLFSKALEYDPKSILTKIKLARYYIGFELEKARTMNEEAMAREPENEDAIINKALILAKENHIKESVGVLQNLLTKKPGSIQATLSLSAIYALDKNQADLEALLVRSVENNPSAIPLRVTLAKVYYQKADYAQAEQQLHKVIELAPDVLPHRVGMAQFYIARKQNDKAENILRAAIKEDPQDQARYGLLIKFLSNQSGDDKTIAELKTIIAEHPDFALLKFDLAKRLINKKQFSDADEIYRSLIDEYGVDKFSIEARQNLAQSLLVQGEKDGAVTLLDEILQQDAKNNDALVLKGKLALFGGNPAEAVSLFRQILRDQPKNANVHQLMARALVRTGAPDVAREHLEKAVDLDPKNTNWGIALARLLQQTGKYKQALDLLDSTLAEKPGDLNILEAKSNLQAVQGDRSGMENTLNTLRANHPELAQADFKLGQLYLAGKEYQKAVTAFRKALEKQPDYVEALAGLLEVNHAAGNPDRSERELAKFLGKYPKSSVARGMMGGYHLSRKEFSKAIGQLELALKEQPTLANAMSLLINAHQQQGTIDQAIAFLNQSIRNNPNHPIAHAYLGQIYLSQKQPKLAEQALLKAKKVTPKAPAIYKSLADLYWAQNDRLKTVAMLEEGIAQMPGNNALGMELGIVQIATNNIESAITTYEKIISTNPKQIWAKNNLAALLSDHRTDGKSLNRAYELALSLKDVDHPVMQDTLGWIYYKLNDTSRAIPLLEKASKAKPKSPLIQYHLGMAFYKQGQNDKAKQHLSAALQIGGSFPELNEARELYNKL